MRDAQLVQHLPDVPPRGLLVDAVVVPEHRRNERVLGRPRRKFAEQERRDGRETDHPVEHRRRPPGGDGNRAVGRIVDQKTLYQFHIRSSFPARQSRAP